MKFPSCRDLNCDSLAEIDRFTVEGTRLIAPLLEDLVLRMVGISGKGAEGRVRVMRRWCVRSLGSSCDETQPLDQSLKHCPSVMFIKACWSSSCQGLSL